MKSLSQHISEKLIINKNYKNVDDIETMFDNVEFKQQKNIQGLFTNKDIFSMMADYIRGNNIKSFSDFDSYKKRVIEDDDACLAVFNKRIKEIEVFKNTSHDLYKCLVIKRLVIFKRAYPDLYKFEQYGMRLSSMEVLKNKNTWNNADDVEYYEISKETFNDVLNLYNRLDKK